MSAPLSGVKYKTMGFFDKLKREVEGTEETPTPELPKEKAGKKKEAKSKPKKLKVKPAEQPQKAASREEILAPAGREETDFEGELAIDVYETDGDFVIKSTIAGVKADDLDIAIENDIVTIRGSRQKQTIEEAKKYYYQECYWGAFSRQVILPEEVNGSKAEAAIKDGILTLKIPKIAKVQKRKIAIKQEE